MARSMPSRTIFGPKHFFTPLSSILGLTAICRSLAEEDGGEDVVRRQNQDRSRHHRIGGGRADALRAAFGIEAIVATHQRDDEAEHRRLDQPRYHVLLRDEARGVLQIVRAVEVQAVCGDDVAAEY